MNTGNSCVGCNQTVLKIIAHVKIYRKTKKLLVHLPAKILHLPFLLHQKGFGAHTPVHCTFTQM